jgi:hypothetical protein
MVSFMNDAGLMMNSRDVEVAVDPLTGGTVVVAASNDIS